MFHVSSPAWLLPGAVAVTLILPPLLAAAADCSLQLGLVWLVRGRACRAARLRRAVGARLVRLACWGPGWARWAAARLRPLVYAGDPAWRRVGLEALAAVARRQPAAPGASEWRWRVQAHAAVAEDPALAAAVGTILAHSRCPRVVVPAAEAALWAELAADQEAAAA